MSGRAKAGRGRGRAHGNLEALGLKPGDGLPPPILQPPPLYPPKDRRPLELSATDTDQDLLCIKQGLRLFMRQSPYYLKPENTKKDFIERYRDKYSASEGTDFDQFLRSIPDWSVVPKELHIQVAKKPKRLQFKPTVSSQRLVTNASLVEKGQVNGRQQKRDQVGSVDVSGRLEQLEKEEQTGSEGEVTGGETEEEYDEEVEEEEGDYQQSYFDPGDEYGVDEDDNLDDGPSY